MKLFKLSVASIALAFMGFASSANAASVTIDINADWDAATTGLISAAPVSFGGPIASINSITVELSHTYAGDLEMNLAGPGGVSLVLSVPMFVGNDLGVAGTGSLDDVVAYTFVETGGSVWPTDAALGGGTYDATTWATGPFADPNGWVFNIFDAFGGDAGAVGSVTIDYTPVPLPAALWMMMAAVGGLGFMRRR